MPRFGGVTLRFLGVDHALARKVGSVNRWAINTGPIRLLQRREKV